MSGFFFGIAVWSALQLVLLHADIITFHGLTYSEVAQCSSKT